MESQFFGIEFDAIRIEVEIIENFMYKLCCFGVFIDVPAELLCDNKSMVKNSSVPASVFSKLCRYIFSHWLK